MNNPIMYSDESGQSPDSIWKSFLRVVGVGLTVLTVPVVIASGGTLLVPILVGAGVGACLSRTVNLIRKNDWSKYKPIIPVPVLPLYPLF